MDARRDSERHKNLELCVPRPRHLNRSATHVKCEYLNYDNRQLNLNLKIEKRIIYE